MNISPSQSAAPQYPTLFAASLTGLAALTLSSCTCQRCEGSGLLMRTASGLVPCAQPPSGEAPSASKTVPCPECCVNWNEELSLIQSPAGVILDSRREHGRRH